MLMQTVLVVKYVSQNKSVSLKLFQWLMEQLLLMTSAGAAHDVLKFAHNKLLLWKLPNRTITPKQLKKSARK